MILCQCGKEKVILSVICVNCYLCGSLQPTFLVRKFLLQFGAWLSRRATTCLTKIKSSLTSRISSDGRSTGSLTWKSYNITITLKIWPSYVVVAIFHFNWVNRKSASFGYSFKVSSPSICISGLMNSQPKLPYSLGTSELLVIPELSRHYHRLIKKNRIADLLS